LWISKSGPNSESLFFWWGYHTSFKKRFKRALILSTAGLRGARALLTFSKKSACEGPLYARAGFRPKIPNPPPLILVICSRWLDSRKSSPRVSLAPRQNKKTDLQATLRRLEDRFFDQWSGR